VKRAGAGNSHFADRRVLAGAGVVFRRIGGGRAAGYVPAITQKKIFAADLRRWTKFRSENCFCAYPRQSAANILVISR